jgi:hypothetical protein
MLKNRAMFFFSIIIVSVLLSCNNNLASPIEIPFALENRRIVLSANVNGTKGRFLWDTGASVSSIDTHFDNLRLTGSILHTDYDTTERVNVYALNNITIGNVKLNINSHIMAVSEGLQQALDKDGLDGVLGADTLLMTVLNVP